MQQGSQYRLEKSRLYHFPHNSALLEEFIFLLKVLDPKKTNQKVYTFKEICKHLLIEEVTSGKFPTFHPKPNKIFTKTTPPDLDTLILDMRKMHPRMGKDMALELAHNRKLAYKKFLKDPEENYDKFVDTQYKPTKTWRQNWVEFVRDYADLAAYCGLLPAYFKNPLGDSEEDGYVVSGTCVEYLEGKLTIEEILMGMKYANSSINLFRFSQFNIEVRPFYSALRLLVELEKVGVKMIDKKLLGAAIGCLRSENEIEEAAQVVTKEYGAQMPKFSNKPKTPGAFVREGERFSLSLVAFLESSNLVFVSEGRNAKFVRISGKGKKLLERTPRKSAFYNHLIDGAKLTPLLAYFLNIFSKSVSSGRDSLEISSLSDIQKVVERHQFDDAIGEISRLTPSPIKSISQSQIMLNGLECQYLVNPNIDFPSYAEADFVSRGIASIALKAPVPIVTRPSKLFLDNIRDRALASDGSDYETAIADAIEALKIGKVRRLGHWHAGQRYTDIVWEVPIFDSLTNTEQVLLVMIDAKAGGAIRAFDERAAKDDIITTLKEKYRNLLPKVAGVWLWIVDSLTLPTSKTTHGGARPGAKTFEEKMYEMLQVTSFAGKLTVVAALNVDSFLQYYSYLFSALSQVTPPLTEINMHNFWIWGPAFRPLNGYVFIYDDVNEMNRRLMAS